MHWNLCKVHLTEWRLILPLTWKSSWHLLLSVEIFKILQNGEIWQSTLNTCSSKVQYSWKSLILQLPVIEKKLNAIIYRYLDRWCIWTAANSNSVFTNEGFDLEFRWDEISSDLTCNALFSNTLSTFWLLHAVSTFEEFLPKCYTARGESLLKKTQTYGYITKWHLGTILSYYFLHRVYQPHINARHNAFFLRRMSLTDKAGQWPYFGSMVNTTGGR